MTPSVYATLGEITLDQSEFTLYRGSNISFPVIAEMSDYSYRPTLEITHNGDVTQKISLYSVGDTFQSYIGLNDNWSSGEYIINLKHRGEILDSKSFTILRDNEVKSEIILYENMSQTVEPFISLSTDKLVLENSSHEIIYIEGNLYISQTGHFVIIDVTNTDGTIDTISAPLNSDGTFLGLIPIDKHWSAGEYLVSASYLDDVIPPKSFNIQNNWEIPIFTEAQLVGSFEITSEISHDYTILGVTGNIETDETQVTLSIGKDDVVMYDDVVLLDDGSFETSIVLYDYITNTPWEYGEYFISGLIGEKSFHSKTFTLNEQSFTVPQTQNMDLFMNMKGEMQKMVDIFEVEINAGQSQQVILSGNIDDYTLGNSVTVHLINPDGVDSVFHLIASGTGDYYMPIIVNDSWASGQYTAYITYGDFMDEVSVFSVINHTILSDESVIENEITIESDAVEIKNYSVSFSDTQSSSSVHYTATMESYSGKTPIVISLDDEIIDELFTYSGNDGVIDYYLLLDSAWSNGNYTVSYVESEKITPFGTFTIVNSHTIEDKVDTISKKLIIEKQLTLDQTLFKSSSYVVEYLQFSGKLSDDLTKKVSVLLDGELKTVLPLDSDGNYVGVISLGDNLDSGFYSVTIVSGNVTESAEFLIATNHSVPLEKHLKIFRNSIVEAGGEISVSLTNTVPNFIPSEIEPVVITVEGDNYYKKFSLMPQGYGHYSQNFMIDDTLGSYDVSVTYGGKLIESYNVNVLLPAPEWIKSHTGSWLDGEISDYSYFKKIVLMLDDDYTVTPNVTCPDWFSESADKWMQGMMDDDSFNDAVLFLAENRLL